MASPTCLRLFAQVIRWALPFARLRAGNNIAGKNRDDRDDHQQFNQREGA